MSSQSTAYDPKLDQLLLDKLDKDLHTLAGLVAEKKRLKTTLDLNLTSKEELDLNALMQNIKYTLEDNSLSTTHSLYEKFNTLVAQNAALGTSAVRAAPDVKKVRFDIDEQDKSLAAIHEKLKLNKQKIIKDINPELMNHDHLIKDLEQGLDNGLIKLNKINNASVLPAWKRSGGSRREELKRGFIIFFLLLVLFLLWLL